jgi:hypothetical protein
MLGAPKGFIQTREGDLLNVRNIGSVSDYSKQAKQILAQEAIWWFQDLKLEVNKFPIIAVTCDSGVWYFQMSVQQFAARMVEALAE